MKRVQLLSLALGTLLAGCYSIIEPESTLPPDAVRTEPGAQYAQWYAETESCTGETGSFSDVRWFVVPHERWWDPLWEQFAIGTWRAPHDIYLAGSHLENEDLVKHEIVHDLLRGGEIYDPRFESCSGIGHGP
jgi:hypothetical protein